MAYKQMYGILAVILTVLPAIAVAKEFVVGDDSGWTINFDYKTWAADKDFRVGDKLVFKYAVGAHNVFKVNGTGFQDCIVPPLTEAMTTGNDVITLNTPGRKWYLCGVGKHCEARGQKLFITVAEALQGPSLSPSSTPNGGGGGGVEAGAPTPNSAIGILTSGSHALVAVIAVIAMAFMV